MLSHQMPPPSTVVTTSRRPSVIRCVPGPPPPRAPVIVPGYRRPVPTYSPQLTALLDREPVLATGVETAEVDYDVDGVACRGFTAAPVGDGPHPSVLVLHDWTGVGDYVQMRCEMLARLGYLAFAGDVYGADVRPDQSEAAGVAGGYYGDPALFATRVVGAFEAMLADPRVDAVRTAAVGYCFGGSAALLLARTGADVAAVTSFHGILRPDLGEASEITAKVQVLTGAADPLVDPDAVAAYEADLSGTPEVDWQLTSYAGAMHAFTQPDANAPDHGAQFQARAEARSWAAMKTFLAEALG